MNGQADDRPPPDEKSAEEQASDLIDRLAALLASLPEEARRHVQKAWEDMPPDVRRDLRMAAGTLEGLLREKRAALRQIMELVKRSVTSATQTLSDVVVVGAVNVGKSSLYNALIADQAESAHVSPLPGTTKDVQSAEVGPFRITDTPGAEHWADFNDTELERAVDAARSAGFLLMVFDASRGILAADRTLYDRLQALGTPYIVVLNKIDLIAPRQRQQVRQAAAAALGLLPEQILLVSAREGIGVSNILLEAAVAEPRLLGYLGRLIPHMRRQFAWQAVRSASTSSMVIGMIPLPLVDLIPLISIQIGMLLTIARIYGQPIGVARAGEIVGTFGFALLGRALFHELILLGGVPGWVLAGSIAGATTMTIGVTAMRWFETGNRPTRADVRKWLKLFQGRLGSILKGAFKRRPRQAALEKELDAALPEPPPLDPA